MFFRKKITICLLALSLAGCNPSSLEEYQQEGESISKKMVQDLEKVHSRDDLVRIVPVLEKRFHQLVDLAIEAKKFKETDDAEDIILDSAKEMSDKLRAELNRVYQLEGAKELIEQAEREALFKLDAFERSVAKRNQTKKSS